MEQWVIQNIDKRIVLAERMYGMYRYWKAGYGYSKCYAWKEYLSMRREYKRLMDEFDTDGRILDHHFSLARHSRTFPICKYRPDKD